MRPIECGIIALGSNKVSRMLTLHPSLTWRVLSRELDELRVIAMFAIVRSASIFCTICCCVSVADAQLTHQFGGEGNDESRTIVQDSSGATYLLGWFSEQVTFATESGDSTLLSAGGHDAFLARLIPSGGFLWLNQIGGEGDDEFLQADLGPDGSIYVVGRVGGVVDLDPGPETILHEGDDDIYLARFKADGALVWAHALPGVGGDGSNSISVDGLGNAYISGMFQEVVNLNPDGEETLLHSAGGRDILVAKYDSAGAFVWGNRFGTYADETGRGVAVNTDSTFCLTADFSQPIDIDPGPGKSLIFGAGGLNAFVATFKYDGQLVWAEEVLSTGASQFTDIAAGPTGTCYAGGWFADDALFGYGVRRQTLSSYGDLDAVTAAYDAKDGFKWVRRIGSSARDRVNRVSVDASGNVYSSGSFAGAIDLDPGDGVDEVDNAGLTDAFVTVLDPLGDFAGRFVLGGPGLDNAIDAIPTTSGKTLITGFFSDQIVVGDRLIVSSGDTDIFVLEAQLSRVQTSASIEGLHLDGGMVLGQNYPNPFVGTTTVPFAIDREAHVRLTITDLLGRTVRTVFDQQVVAGVHEVRVSPSLPSGVYLYRMTVGDGEDVEHSSQASMVIVR